MPGPQKCSHADQCMDVIKLNHMVACDDDDNADDACEKICSYDFTGRYLTVLIKIDWTKMEQLALQSTSGDNGLHLQC